MLYRNIIRRVRSPSWTQEVIGTLFVQLLIKFQIWSHVHLKPGFKPWVCFVPTCSQRSDPPRFQLSLWAFSKNIWFEEFSPLRSKLRGNMRFSVPQEEQTEDRLSRPRLIVNHLCARFLQGAVGFTFSSCNKAVDFAAWADTLKTCWQREKSRDNLTLKTLKWISWLLFPEGLISQMAMSVLFFLCAEEEEDEEGLDVRNSDRLCVKRYKWLKVKQRLWDVWNWH